MGIDYTTRIIHVWQLGDDGETYTTRKNYAFSSRKKHVNLLGFR